MDILQASGDEHLCSFASSPSWVREGTGLTS